MSSEKISHRTARSLGYGLALFSIGLGAVEVFGARQLSRGLGMGGQEKLVRAFGLREIANGVGILLAEDKAAWVWGRVGGDALDMGALVSAAGRGNKRRWRVFGAIAAVAGVTLADLVCATAYSLDRTWIDRGPARDFSDRSGLPKGVAASRGIARAKTEQSPPLRAAS
jgi:hypothetical protein